MKAASQPRANSAGRRLLVIDGARRTLLHALAVELDAQLTAEDLLIVNDAATLPASLRLRDLDAELRLVARGGNEAEYLGLLFGPGDYRTPTELRPAPPLVAAGQALLFEGALAARVLSIDPRSPRLVRLRFALSGARLLLALYESGRPIQYAHVPQPLAVWDVQNRFASRPWALEAPSAGFSLDGEQLTRLALKGIRVARLTHAAGVSSTGSAELDAHLPLPERFEIPADTVRCIELTEHRRGRVIAVGTSVVRALEASAALYGAPRAGPGLASSKLGARSRRRVVDGVLSGVHEPGTSHFALLESFADAELLKQALLSADHAGYVAHEFGDVCLVLGSGPRRGSRGRANTGCRSGVSARACAAGG